MPGLPVRTLRRSTHALLPLAFLWATLALGEDDGKVDGYKQHKFGITRSALKFQKPCQLGKERRDESGLTLLECGDFSFGLVKAAAAFGFVEGKLRVVTLTLPKGKAAGVVDLLGEKYGVPSRSSTAEEFKLAETPGNSAEVCFSEDTVCATSTWQGKEAVVVIRYAASDLEELLQKYKRSKIIEDL